MENSEDALLGRDSYEIEDINIEEVLDAEDPEQTHKQMQIPMTFLQENQIFL